MFGPTMIVPKWLTISEGAEDDRAAVAGID